MKKIKGLLFAFVALFAFTLALVTVSAADEKYGVYTVSEEGKKAEWDFTQNKPSANYSITTVSDEKVYGIGGATAKVQFKNAGNLSNGGTDGANIYVPVPSADAAGSISFVGNNNTRYVELTVSGGTKIYAKTNGQNETAFTSADVSESNGHYYLTLVGSNAGAELKATKLTVTLTTGAYELTAAKITVTLKDASDKVLRTDATVESGSVYEKGYATWGFDTTGYFLDKELTQSYNNSELTEDTTLYVGLNAWDGVITNPNHLSNELVAKLDGVEIGDVCPLTGTIYSVLKTATYGVKTGDDGYSYISTGGATSERAEKAVQINAPESGTLIVHITSGGDSQRNAKVVNVNTKEAVSVLEGNVAWTADEAKAYEVRALTYKLDAGTYNIGGDNGMRILSVEFIPTTPTPDPEPDGFYMGTGYNENGTELVRIIGVVEGLTEAELNEYLANMKLIVKGGHLASEGYDISSAMVIASSLTTNDGKPYSIEDTVFEENEETLYFVCVLAVSNDGKGLEDQFKGVELEVELSAHIEDQSQILHTWHYTVQGAQA